jgi:nitroimidazol reductase NimA-like FMN-containing flavoprotein (pyridoxamine 5'-phosphate oxidase superfamily)
MNPKMKKFILHLLKDHNLMSIATVRPDGYPQATTVTYANDGLALYFACDLDSQKVKNLKKCPKVSLTIDRDYKNWRKIKGLSMGANARVLIKPSEIQQGLKLLMRKFPGLKDLSEEDLAATAIVKVAPKVISVINYTKEFGHTDLVKV